jgi:hypothetical protein
MAGTARVAGVRAAEVDTGMLLLASQLVGVDRAQSLVAVA